MAIIGTDTARAAAHLKAGELVAIPTETVYGLAANALDVAAVANIFAVKARPSFDPLILHIADWRDLATYVTALPPQALVLATAFWPGPLTMVFPKREIVPDLVTAGLPSVAVRMPSHPMALTLLQELDFPLAAPSANPFGYVSPTTAAHVAKQLGDKIPYILDGGPCEVGLESTIVSFATAVPTVLRKGGLALEAIFEALGQEIAVQTHSNSKPSAPGMLAQHYAPEVPFRLGSYLGRDASSAKAYLVFGPDMPTTEPHVYNLSPKADMAEAARNLFAIMRQLDQANYQEIVAQLLPEQGLGAAINDRLRRAASRG